MQTLDFDIHTMIILVGPSGCGKSHFSKNKLLPSLEAATDKIIYLSSDDIRREVLGVNCHKHDPIMMRASGAAFVQLHNRVDEAMSWPNKAHFVVVDTTGLSSRFRNKLEKQAKDKNYNIAVVAFDYETDEEYAKYNTEDPKFKTEVMVKHINHFHEISGEGLGKYNKVHKVKVKDWSSLEIRVNDIDLYKRCILDPTKKYDVISDVHGCFDELMELLGTLGYGTEWGVIGRHRFDPDRRLVFVGDLIDKGPSSIEVLRAVEWGYTVGVCDFVLGNHENFVHKYLTGQIRDAGMPQEAMDKHFSCIKQYGNDEYFKKLLAWYCDNAKPFLVGPGFVVTHGPSMNRDLERLDTKSKKRQMKGPEGRHDMHQMSVEEKKVAYQSFYKYLRDEACGDHPMHIYGHTASKNVMELKNKKCIDTGCVHGGFLAALSTDRDVCTLVPVREEGGYAPDELFDTFERENQ